MGIIAWIRGIAPPVAHAQATITKQDRDSEITPTRQLDSQDLKAMQIGYCVIRNFSSLLPQIEADIERAKEECIKTWRGEKIDV